MKDQTAEILMLEGGLEGAQEEISELRDEVVDLKNAVNELIHHYNTTISWINDTNRIVKAHHAAYLAVPVLPKYK